ncbi:MAG: hybrid sensor histidine kinase/response regulator, partial [Nitrospirales bacterium]
SAFLAYSLPTALPVIVQFLLEGDQFHVAMGMMGVVFLAMMLMTMWRNHSVLLKAMRLQLEKINLITHLSDERDKAKALNYALAEEVKMGQVLERELVQHRAHLEHLVEDRTSQLRTSETRFFFLAENITDLIWMMDINGQHFSYMSPAIEGLLGYSPKDVATLSLKDVLTTGSLQSAQVVMAEELALSQDQAAESPGFRTLELEHLCKDGSTIWAEIRASLVRDDRGAPIGFVGVTRDMTERRKVEEEKRRLETQLIRSQKMEAIGTLAGGIAHDFNNLLTGVLGNISLAKGVLADRNPSFQFLVVAEHESIRAKGLTQQLLTFAKGGDPIKSLASLEVLVKNTVEFALSGSALAREYVYDEPLWLVEIDAGQISQVVQSLVTNAVQAMPQDGQLTIHWENFVYDETSPCQDIPVPYGCYVKISFADNGVGISSDDLPKIFDPYFTTKPDGHGLGLTSVYAITKKHNGHTTVESTIGKGTCVSLYFPATPKQEKVAPPVPLVRRKGTGKVLIMDDEESIRMLASEMLRACGYYFEAAKNGEEAVMLYQEAQKDDQPFSAVILDLTVPGGLGGKEAMDQLLQIDPNVKAVVTSGYSNDPVMAKYRNFGFQAVMTKPYTLLELSDVMYRMVMEPSDQGTSR